MQYVRRKSNLDQLAANLPEEVKKANGMSQEDPDDPIVQAQHMQQMEQQVQKARQDKEQNNKKSTVDWSVPKQINEVVALGQAADKNPANLNKSAFGYQKRINYSEQYKNSTINGVPLVWTEEDLKKMEEEEEKFAADPRFVNWD